MEQSTTLSLFHVDEIMFPFIEGAFVCKTGKVLEGFFLIDTGSTENMFNYEAIHTLADENFVEESKTISAIQNQGEECRMANISIKVGNIESNEVFCISKQISFEQAFGKNQIIGVLGVDFLRKNHLVLDLEKKCLSTSSEEDFSLENKSFVFPMGFGFHHYGIPVIGIIKDKQEFVCVVDSGSNYNTLSQYALDHGTEKAALQEGGTTIHGLFGSIDASLVNAEFSLLSIGDKEGETVLKKDAATFQILQGQQYLAKSGVENVPPLHGLIGTKYMLQKKWVLDFGKEVIYSQCA